MTRRETKQRRLVLQAVRSRHDHPTAEQIYEDVHATDPKISHGTVYRNLNCLSEDGIMIVVMTLERHSNVVLAGPDIVSRGFVYVRESEDLMEHARQVVETALDSCLENNITDWGKIKTEVKDALGEYLWKRTKRSPMILPIIMEA